MKQRTRIEIKKREPIMTELKSNERNTTKLREVNIGRTAKYRDKLI